MGAGGRSGEGKDQGNKHKAYLPDFHPEAEKEHILAVADYELAQKGLGLRFHEEVQHLIAKILVNPFLYPAASLRRRKAVLDYFPYCIYYVVWKRKRIVTILSIHHAKRKASRWQRRKPKWRS
jgi:hypothetical protein